MITAVLLIISVVACLIGILGSFFPGIPGISLSWLGLLLLFLVPEIPFNFWLLGISLIIALGIMALGYWLPVKTSQRFGGSRYASIGTVLGLIIGLIAPIPFGIVIGAFVGAYLGEYLFAKNNSQDALKAAWGSLLGFLGSAFTEFLATLVYLGIFIVTVYRYRSVFF